MPATGPGKPRTVEMYRQLRPLLFRLDAEISHDLVMRACSLASRSDLLNRWIGTLYNTPCRDMPVDAMGIRFPNPIGLAAGLDKQGCAINTFEALGFGFVEVGTVTPLPQAGNPRPRLFRLTDQQAVINRMGFNSVGIKAFKSNLKQRRGRAVLGINIGKNAGTPVSRSAEDYLHCLRNVHDCADYIVVNISSPNTMDLRTLQQANALEALLTALDRERLILADQSGHRTPLAVKVAPDLEENQVQAIAELVRKHRVDGIIATNTTVSRTGIRGHFLADEPGGLSGCPLRERSTRIVDLLYRNLQGEIPVIGVGGITDPVSALEKIQAGARLIQIYTGLVYHGPGLVKKILDTLHAHGYPP